MLLPASFPHPQKVPFLNWQITPAPLPLRPEKKIEDGGQKPEVRDLKKINSYI
jgi:hypothetical protein